MQKLYLILAAVGFAIPMALLPATLANDNLFLIAKPAETVELLFANYVSSAFSADLLWVFVVFCVWVVIESRKLNLSRPWLFVALAFLFGVSGPLPLFLYYRERAAFR